MNITVINGTGLQGVTYKLKEMFLEPFRGEAQIEEFYLPKDCPDFCVGCRQQDRNCKKDRKNTFSYFHLRHLLTAAATATFRRRSGRKRWR